LDRFIDFKTYKKISFNKITKATINKLASTTAMYKKEKKNGYNTNSIVALFFIISVAS
jgi:hypothetical protein